MFAVFAVRRHFGLGAYDARASYMRKKIGDWGEIIDAGDPHREIGFGFVSCSCRVCERRGEAKLCGRVREQCFPTLGLEMERSAPA